MKELTAVEREEVEAIEARLAVLEPEVERLKERLYAITGVYAKPHEHKWIPNTRNGYECVVCGARLHNPRRVA